VSLFIEVFIQKLTQHIQPKWCYRSDTSCNKHCFLFHFYTIRAKSICWYFFAELSNTVKTVFFGDRPKCFLNDQKN